MISLTKDSVKKILENLDDLSDSKAKAAELEVERYRDELKTLEARAEKAEATAKSLEARAEKAEATAKSLEARAEKAETTAKSLNIRAEKAETTARSLNIRAEKAETTAKSLEARAEQAKSELELERERVRSIMEDYKNTEVELEYEANRSYLGSFGRWLSRYIFCCCPGPGSQRQISQKSHNEWANAIANGRSLKQGTGNPSFNYELVM